MLTKHTLLVCLCFILQNAALVAAESLERRALFPGELNTNAKRFAAGLPPLPPSSLKRHFPSRVDTAKRSRASVTTKRCKIDVRNTGGETSVGYLSKTLKDGHFTLENGADTFSTYIYFDGNTENINLMDADKPGYYLAGIVSPGATLNSDSDGVAKLGESFPTQPGDEPRSDRKSTIPGESETAIWTYSPSSGLITPQWVNGGYSYPKSVTAYVFYDKSTDTFYLAGSQQYGSFSSVEFHLYCS